MIVATRARSNTAALLAILALSAATMVWLFWHFPVITAVATLAILTSLGVSARLARLTDTEAKDLSRSQQGV
jgi:CHASE2 domain-containing sensor protein